MYALVSALIFLLVGCAPVWPAPVSVPTPTITGQPVSRYGVVALLGPTQIEAVRTLGVGSVRIGIDWIDRQPERDGPIDFSDLDAQLQRAGDLSVLVTLGYSPAWAASCRACPPDLEAWRAFVRAVLTRYQGRQNVVWGVWNEPNGDEFFRDTEQATNYADLFRAAIQERDQVTPAARLAAPETAYHAAPPATYYASAMAEIGPLLQPQDVVTVHWYRASDAPPLIPYMRFIAARAVGHEVWLTEANGNATCDDAQQQQDVAYVLHAMDSDLVPEWTRTFLYVLHDGIPCGMGILQPDFAPRAAFDWYRDYITQRTQ